MPINMKTNLSLVRTINSSIRIAFNASTSSTTLPTGKKKELTECMCLSTGISYVSFIREVYTPLIYVVRHIPPINQSRTVSKMKFTTEYPLNNHFYTVHRKFHSIPFHSLRLVILSIACNVDHYKTISLI